ncbi:hypothetical protein HDV00_006216 [Rhizophlyctis rosea]|nr:hypothetical protein HDV00_006216 [Rhizophlyctis rosea]
MPSSVDISVWDKGSPSASTSASDGTDTPESFTMVDKPLSLYPPNITDTDPIDPVHRPRKLTQRDLITATTKVVTAIDSQKEEILRMSTHLQQTLDATKISRIVSAIEETAKEKLRSVADFIASIDLNHLGNALESTKDTAAQILSAINTTNEKSSKSIILTSDSLSLAQTNTTKLVNTITTATKSTNTTIETAKKEITDAIESVNKQAAQAHKIQTLQWAISNAHLKEFYNYNVTNIYRRTEPIEYRYESTRSSGEVKNILLTFIRGVGYTVGPHSMKDLGRCASAEAIRDEYDSYVEAMANQIHYLTGKKPRIHEHSPGKKSLFWE